MLTFEIIILRELKTSKLGLYNPFSLDNHDFSIKIVINLPDPKMLYNRPGLTTLVIA